MTPRKPLSELEADEIAAPKRVYDRCLHCGKKIELVTWHEHLPDYWRHWDNDQLDCAPTTRATPSGQIGRIDP